MFSFSNLNLWLPLFSAVFWIGAIFFTWWVLIPGVRSLYPIEEVPLRVVSLEKKFRKLAHLFIALITVTGVLNLMSPESLGKFKSSPNFAMLVSFKVILLAVLVLLHIFRFTIYAKKIETSAENQKISLAGLQAWHKSKTFLIVQA